MTYPEALAWLSTLPRLANTPGVQNTSKLLAALGNPERSLRFVHIAGTNGKGSTTTMLSSVLKTAGYKVGTSVSPYVLDFCERFQINGTMIAQSELAQIVTQVRCAAERIGAVQKGEMVEFDAVTAASLLWFAQQQCDIVCLEVGLGGRLDSTNAVQNTLVACVLSIAYDHTELLGNTLAAIAAEKCGIFKNQCHVVAYPQTDASAQDVIARAAEAAHCPMVVVQSSDIVPLPHAPLSNAARYRHLPLTLPLLGAHQAKNAAVVCEAAFALSAHGYTVSDADIQQGIADAQFPARIEVLSHKPLVLLDGAHNPDGALALRQTLDAAGVGGLAAVMGVLHGKNAIAMLQTLAPCIHTLYAATPNNPRAMHAQELAVLAAPYIANCIPCADLPQAIAAAKAGAQQGVLVCGSLYLAAEARPLLLK